jgi:5-methylcytosine-specific restriction protein B
MASYILAYAQGRGQAVNDLLDVHNMIYMFRQYDEFEAVGNPVQHNSSDESIYDFLRNQGFIFPDWLVTDYALSLATKPFVILSGISGTGKTKLAQLVAEYVLRSIGYDDGQAFVSVRPDWTDNSHLLGWYNAISEQYEATPVLRLIGRASDTPEKPHFIILDEMNIARVEHYFSDFLSCMESRWIDASGTLHQAPIQLHSRGNDDEAGELDVAPQVDLPLNVYVIGTVNVDESTFMFSPKVLDRASVIELNDVCLDESSVDDTTAPYSGQFLLRSGVALSSILARYKPVTHHRLDEMREKMPGQFRQLLAIQAALRQHHRHFGYRVASEIAALMVNAQQYCVECEAVLPIAFDLQVMQKILPKLHGNAAQLHGPLESLAEAIPSSCLLSHAKIARMQSRLQQIGFASFID